jgi:hypothetical protein
MLVDADEITEVAERANNLEVAIYGHFRRTGLLLELGDMKGAVAAVETMHRLNTRLRQPFFTPWELGTKATMALMRGALAEAERLILENMRIQLPLKTRITDPLSLLIFTLRREQGRLREFAPFAEMFVRQSGERAIWLPGLALLYVEVGNLAAAREVFSRLAASRFESLPRDGRWATCIMYLAEVCVALDDRNSGSVLYRLLLPWKDRNIVMGGAPDAGDRPTVFSACWRQCRRAGRTPSGTSSTPWLSTLGPKRSRRWRTRIATSPICSRSAGFRATRRKPRGISTRLERVRPTSR